MFSKQYTYLGISADDDEAPFGLISRKSKLMSCPPLIPMSFVHSAEPHSIASPVTTATVSSPWFGESERQGNAD
jgi:hypothetical protein